MFKIKNYAFTAILTELSELISSETNLLVTRLLKMQIFD